jgi:hypothetical protein
MYFTHKPADFVDIVIGWAIHVALIALAVGARRNWMSIVVYILICVALALNVSGCRTFLEGLNDLH